MPRARDRRSARWPGTGEGYRNVEGHKFGFGAVNCTASVAAGARATVPETECVEGVGDELVSACMTPHGPSHGIPYIIPYKETAEGVAKRAPDTLEYVSAQHRVSLELRAERLSARGKNGR